MDTRNEEHSKEGKVSEEDVYMGAAVGDDGAVDGRKVRKQRRVRRERHQIKKYLGRKTCCKVILLQGGLKRGRGGRGRRERRNKSGRTESGSGRGGEGTVEC